MPLHKRMEERYYSESYTPELEHKKQILAEIRDKLKPMDMSEIDMHEILYKMKKRERASKSTKITSSVEYKKGIHISSHLQDVMLENMRFKEQLKLKEEVSKLKRNKMVHYGQVIKDTKIPTIDDDKRKEIEFRKQNFTNLRTKIINTDLEEAEKKLNDPETKARLGVTSMTELDYKKRKFKPNPLVPAPKIKRPPVEIKYLEEKRFKKGAIKDRMEIEYKPVNWKKEFKKPEIEKFDSIFDKSLQISKDHDEVEQYLRVKNDGWIGINQTQNLNNMLIDAIKAKVALLENVGNRT